MWITLFENLEKHCLEIQKLLLLRRLFDVNNVYKHYDKNAFRIVYDQIKLAQQFDACEEL